MSNETPEIIVPTVGMGVTECVGSDRYAGTITRVSKSGKQFWFTHDDVKLVDGSCMSEHQVYEYTPRPDGGEICAKLSRTRYDLGKNVYRVGKYTRVALNVRRQYSDPSF